MKLQLTDFEIVRTYKERFDILKQTPQDPVHHQEGDVYTHTEMVLNALVNLPEYAALTPHEQRVLTYTALFHDICKPETLEYYGETQDRISNPRHAQKGASWVRQLLDREGESLDFIRQVHYLVRFHGHPFHVLNRGYPLSDSIRLSVLSSNKLLYIFAKADLLGRICTTHDDMLYNLEIYREFCLENDIFDKPKTFASDYDRFQYFNVDNSYPDTQLYHQFDYTIYMLCGLPAAGKDSYLKTHLTDLPRVHLDAIREELDIDPTENQGQVIQLSRERSKEYCRRKQSFVWNATNITAKIRATLLGVWMPYKPKIHIIYIHKPIETILCDNARREEMARVPDSKILEMHRRFEFPDLTECHELTIVPCRGG